MTRDYDTIHTVRDCGITGGKEFGETAGGLTCIRQIGTGLSGCVCNEEGYSIRGCRVEGCRGCVTVLRVIVSGAVVLGGAVRGGTM